MVEEFEKAKKGQLAICDLKKKNISICGKSLTFFNTIFFSMKIGSQNKLTRDHDRLEISYQHIIA
jgi:hypothetical protein